MNKFYLPTLERIEIHNFSLYPNGLHVAYDFVEGVNLVIGGNGLGKTTFLNLIKFALIGLYRKETDVKTRLENRIEKRINLPYDYFKNRMDRSFEKNEQAEVVLRFRLDKTVFTIHRLLAEPTVTRVTIQKGKHVEVLNGSPLSQAHFDGAHRVSAQATANTLQRQYEDRVAEASQLGYFDNLIFLVNEILFFGEARKTIVWERDRREESSTQAKLASKYFNDPELDLERTEAERNAKYHDSLSRHYSEDIRAIQKVINQITDTDKSNRTFKQTMLQVEKEKEAISILSRNLTDIENSRRNKERELNTLYSDRNATVKGLEELREAKRAIDEEYFKNLWDKLHPRYHTFFREIQHSANCPLCNQQMLDKVREPILSHEENCMLCTNPINATRPESPESKGLKQKIDRANTQRSNIERGIVQVEEFLKQLDKDFALKQDRSHQAQSRLRRLEFSLQQMQQDNKDPTAFEFKAMKARIDELELLKSNGAEMSRQFRQKVQEIDSKIDEQRIEVRSELSEEFSEYATQFLGVPCELVYDEFGDGLNKRYLPKINGSIRRDEEELSESQRFFIDQSFRMCLLNYFYSSPTFFMCETPDSSLDISYEQNAASIFLKFLEKPNILIITSNLNNSEFLDYIVDHAAKINHLNLLTIGRTSNVQATSPQLTFASKRIEEKIHAKQQ